MNSFEKISRDAREILEKRKRFGGFDAPKMKCVREGHNVVKFGTIQSHSKEGWVVSEPLFFCDECGRLL